MIIDFHSHILPGMDDGSESCKQSLKMLEAAEEQRVEVQAFTPHYYPWRESTEHFLERRLTSARTLGKQLNRSSPLLYMIGAEVAYYPDMAEAELAPLCLEGDHLLLVELPFESWDNQVIDVLAKLALERRFHLILAHVERYIGYTGNVERLFSLRNLPITMQMNCGSFTGLFGSGQAVELAKKLGSVVLGTDCHNLKDRAPNMEDGRRAIRRRLSQSFLEETDRCGTELISEYTT